MNPYRLRGEDFDCDPAYRIHKRPFPARSGPTLSPYRTCPTLRDMVLARRAVLYMLALEGKEHPCRVSENENVHVEAEAEGKQKQTKMT